MRGLWAASRREQGFHRPSVNEDSWFTVLEEVNVFKKEADIPLIGKGTVTAFIPFKLCSLSEDWPHMS